MSKRKFMLVILIGVTSALSLTDSPVLGHLTCHRAHAEAIEQNPTPPPAQNGSFFTRIFGSQQVSMQAQCS
ncbi:MAG: hypothetical protein L0220_34275, partial [Acidobacteria bacterium]|nr:hypothetical protein [Acidobacteriota bacterium]